MGEYQESAIIYTKAIEAEEFVKPAALLKRAITYIDNKQNDEAMSDLQ